MTEKQGLAGIKEIPIDCHTQGKQQQHATGEQFFPLILHGCLHYNTDRHLPAWALRERPVPAEYH